MNEGLIWVKAKCENYYSFILKISAISITILQIKYKDNFIYLKINKNDISKLKKYLPSYSFKIDRYLGIDKSVSLLKKYLFFIVAIAIGTIFLYFATNVIVSVEVIHSDAEIRKLVTNALEDEGIKRLTLKKDYQTITKIKENILNRHKQNLEWLEIETHGMKYVIRVEERIITIPEEEKTSCHIVAKKSGVITKVFTERGVASIASGTYVSEGEILINGNILLNEEIKNTVCASGKVKAEVWYTVKVSLPLKHDESSLTGKKHYNFSYKLNGQKHKIFRSRLTNYATESKKMFSFLGVEFYVEEEKELDVKTLKYSEKEALEKAIELAIEKMNIKRKDYDRILTQKVLKKALNDSTMDIEIFFAIEEDIGKTVEFEREIIEERIGE